MDIFGKNKTPEFKKSYIASATRALIPYVCLNEWNLKKDEVMYFPSRRVLPPELDLHKNIDSIYRFYSTFMHLFPHSEMNYPKTFGAALDSGEAYKDDFTIPSPDKAFNESLSDDAVYFCLFARAAELRFRIDFKILGKLRHKSLSLSTECLFTPEELGLLTGVAMNTVIDSDRNHGIMTSFKFNESATGQKLKKEASELYFVSQSILPDNPEFKDLKTGTTTHELAALYEHEEAMKYLINHKKYKETIFLE